jgi:hypothetical protein
MLLQVQIAEGVDLFHAVPVSSYLRAKKIFV